VIYDQLMVCTRFRFSPQVNTAERWVLRNSAFRRWSHPIHIHLEEFRILSRTDDRGNKVQTKPGNVEFGRKDVVRLAPQDEVEILIRFRDFRGGYPMHCHNTVHEDHQMMLLWDVQDEGDDNTRP
jgi:FtsP/CotA-like multicopper oxidase with cupredoxin domain